MTPRQLKRLEDLLRVLNDKASAPNEKQTALDEALALVSAVRTGRAIPGEEWINWRAMQYYDCEICGENICPPSKAWKRAANDREEWRHHNCHMEAQT